MDLMAPVGGTLGGIYIVQSIAKSRDSDQYGSFGLLALLSLHNPKH